MDLIRFIRPPFYFFISLSICFAIISLLLARILYVLVRSPRRLETYYHPQQPKEASKKEKKQKNTLPNNKSRI